MKLSDITSNFTEQLEESAVRVFKRRGKGMIRYFRCTSGPKAGKYAASPAECAKRKDPKKVRHGKKVARSQKAVRTRKTTITKRSAVSKMLTKMNDKLTQHKPMQHRKNSKSGGPTPASSSSTKKPKGTKKNTKKSKGSK